MSTNNEQLYFYKGLEANLPKTGIKIGALYHCTDTKNTYRGVSTTELVIFSTGVDNAGSDAHPIYYKNSKPVESKYDLAEHDLILDRLRTVTDNIVEYDNAIEGYPLDVISHIDVVQEGEGTPSPDNIRPIIGHSTVNLTQSGKNLVVYPYTEKTKTIYGITFTDNGDGSITISGTATGHAYFYLRNSAKWSVKPGEQYTGKLHKVSGNYSGGSGL